MTSASFTPACCFDLSATIASGQTTSSEIDLGGATLVGLFMPASFTGTTITFTTASAAGGTFVAVYDSSGNAISATVSTSRFVALSPTTFAGLRFIKLVSGSSEGGNRSITLATRPV